MVVVVVDNKNINWLLCQTAGCPQTAEAGTDITTFGFLLLFVFSKNNPRTSFLKTFPLRHSHGENLSERGRFLFPPFPKEG